MCSRQMSNYSNTALYKLKNMYFFLIAKLINQNIQNIHVMYIFLNAVIHFSIL